MTNEDVPAWSQVTAEFLEELFLGCPVKVDYDIPAEDNINRFVKPEFVVHEVQATECYVPAEFGGYAEEIFGVVLAAQQVFSPQRQRDRRYLATFIYGFSSQIQNLCTDISCQDSEG